MKKKTIAAVLFSILGATAIALAAGDWSGAERKVDEFKKEYEQLRKLTPEETKKLVTAICEAEEADRQSVAKDASSRAKDKVNDEYDDLEDLRDEANKKLDDVLADASLKGQHSKANDYKADVKKRWESIEKMTKSIRGANHPVVAWMLERGQKEHKSRQERCHASEVTLDSGRADCIMATGSTCTVIELKPKNSNAIRKGKEQARRYTDELNAELKKTNSEILKKLVSTKSDFAKCKEFEERVDCYTLCPSINDDGEFREVSVDWDEDC